MAVGSIVNVDVLAATLQLKLVQSVLSAMRNADLQTANLSPVSGAAPCGDEYCPCTALNQQPQYAPRPVIHPTPRYLPRPVLHPAPRLAPAEAAPAAATTTAPHITAGPQPPWKVLPWQEPALPRPIVKIIIRPSDTTSIGTLLDLFI